MIDIERLKVDADYWDKVAPLGATHHWEPSGEWYQDCGDYALAWISGEGVWVQGISPLRIVRPEAIPRPTKTERVDGLPDAYVCPAGCGCLWRDNGDDTMSLYGPKSQSCDVCEMEPLKRMVPVKFLRTEAKKQREELLEALSLPLEGLMLTASMKVSIADAILSKYNLTEK